MSIANCLKNAVEGGEISKEEAAELASLYDQLAKRHRAGGSPVADLDAKAELSELLRAEAEEEERRVRISAAVQQRIEADLPKYRTATGKEDIGEAAIQLIEHFGSAPYSSVEGRRKVIIGRAHAMMADVLDTFRRTKIKGTTRNSAKLDNVVREAFGEATGDTAAKALADAWTSTSEWLRQRYNQAGGAIGKLEKWGMPQSHHPLALLNVGKEAWKAAILPLLDRTKMRHPVTGSKILDSEMDDVLGAVWDNIVTEGWATREPSRQPFGRGMLAKQRAEHRFLVFRDADAWLGYAKDFSQGDAFAAMMGHVNGMARDIAALEILGPNPNATVEWLKQSIMKEGAAAVAGKPSKLAPGLFGPKSRVNAKVATLDAMWHAARGASEDPGNLLVANSAAWVRNTTSAAVLGSAILSAVPTDPIFGAFARNFAGLPVAKELHSMLKGLGGMSRDEATRAGLILDSAMHVFSKQARYVGTFSGPQFSTVLPDRVLTYSGLTPWTQAGRHAFGLDFMGTLADHAKGNFADLPKGLQKTFQRWGIAPKDWETMRKAPLHSIGGAPFLRPNEIAGVDQKLAEKTLEMILSETEYAVPSTSLRGRAAIVGRGAKAGTALGEAVRSFGMFKSFGMTYAMLWGARMWRETVATGAAGGAYAGALFTSITLGGMLSIWLKDISAGRDPRPLSKKMAGAAILQGGGLGIFGDFLFADVNRYGGGFATSLAGPAVEQANSLWNLTGGNLIQLAASEDTNFLEELRRFGGGAVPGSSLWYLKLGYQRVLLDQLQLYLDPKANRAFKRRQDYWRKNFRTDHWWRPGQLTPDRAPQVNVAR